MQKKIIIFEGFGSAGKTTIIKKLKNDLENEFRIEVLDSTHPDYASILFADNKKVSIKKSKNMYFHSRWMSLFLFFNSIINSDSELFFFDRGLLTNYIYGKIDGFPDYLLDESVNDILNIIKEKNLIYKTVFVACDLEVANARCTSRENIDVDSKIRRNKMFEPYLKNVSDYYFIEDLAVIDASDTVLKDYENLIQFIKE